MRQIQVTVAPAHEEAVLRLAEGHGAFSPAAASVRTGGGGERSMVFASLPNDRVGAFVEAVEGAVEHAEIVIVPRGVLPLHTPIGDVHEKVRDVAPRSTVELVLGSLQSIGSWRGMLLYALFSGVVGAYAVIFSTPWLLTAAMLIAPFGAPAMVSVVGVAIGDWTMLRRGALRFWVAVAVLAATAVALGTAYGLGVSTQAMEQISSLSTWSVLLALVGGAAGAQALVQSDRDSLVTATATGFLVAVSLSPPTAVLGLSVALGRWDYVAEMAFLLVLTYFGILAGGWASLRLHGVVPATESAGRGSAGVRTGLVAAAALLAALLVAWQSQQGPRFRKGDLWREAVSLAREGVASVPEVRLLQAEAEFTRPDLALPGGGEALLVSVVAERRGGGAPDSLLERRIRAAVEARVRAELDRVHPFVRVTVLPSSGPP